MWEVAREFGFVWFGEKKTALSTEEGRVEREVLVLSPWYLVTGQMGMVKSCAKGVSDLMLGNTFIQRGWSNTGAGFLERWLMPQACWSLKTFGQCPYFNFCLVLKWSVSSTSY